MKWLILGASVILIYAIKLMLIKRNRLAEEQLTDSTHGNIFNNLFEE